jgi:hypothetical protein
MGTVKIGGPPPIQLWMSPALKGSRTAVRILHRVYVSPAMAYLLVSSDTQEEWDGTFRSIPIEILQENSPRAMQIFLSPGAQEIPMGVLDK